MIRLLLLGLIHLYRWTLSPLLAFIGGPGSGCRFSPTCSEYALEAVRMQGSARGAWLALRRLLRCHPWGGWGYDPVPALECSRDRYGHLQSPLSSPASPSPAHTSPSSPH